MTGTDAGNIQCCRGSTAVDASVADCNEGARIRVLVPLVADDGSGGGNAKACGCTFATNAVGRLAGDICQGMDGDDGLVGQFIVATRGIVW